VHGVVVVGLALPATVAGDQDRRVLVVGQDVVDIELELLEVLRDLRQLPMIFSFPLKSPAYLVLPRKCQTQSSVCSSSTAFTSPWLNAAYAPRNCAIFSAAVNLVRAVSMLRP